MSVRFRRSILLGVVFAIASACADAAPPAFRVGSLAFDAGVRTEIPPGGEAALADVAAWGLAVRDERVDSLFAPLAQRAAERSRLRTLPYLLAAQAMGMGDDSLSAAYAADPEWELDVRHVIRLAEEGAPEAERAEARDVALEVLERARAGEDFAALAAQYSEEPGAAERGGLLQPGREGSWVPPFWEAAAGLEPGEVSDVVESEYGYHVIRLDARRPVPFAEADRAALLSSVVPEAEALAAMERWAAAAPMPAVDPGTAEAARQALAAGSLDTGMVIATLSAGESYAGRDLARDWAAADPDDSAERLRAPAAFASWLRNEVREAAWVLEAARLGAPVVRGARQEELYSWLGRGLGWTVVFGFAPAMPDEELRKAALQGATSAGQDFRIARQELEGMRPLLRDAYPFEVPSANTASSSNSDMP